MDNEEKENAVSVVQSGEKNYISLGDTITVQAIVCMIISIFFLVSNMIFPKISQELADEFKSNYYMSPPDDVYETLIEFINSTPVSYD